MLLSTPEKMRAADAEAINARGIPSGVLMENAARHIVSACMGYLESGGGACVFCGSGNNGGDGIAAAYMLLERGVTVRACLVGKRDRMTPDSLEMLRRLERLGGSLEDFGEDFAIPPDCAVIVDAMFGIGLSRPLSGAGEAAAELINASGVPVVAADIASGVMAATGEVPGKAVRASVTVTFSMAKPGHFVEPGCAFCGELRVCDIGIPEDILRRSAGNAAVLEESGVRLPKRDELTHKYDYGRLLILGGCRGYTGAVSMCSRAAVRSGAGVVFTGVPESIYAVTAVKNDEPVVFPLPCDGEGRFSEAAVPPALERLGTAACAVIGPGLARSEGTAALCRAVIENAGCPVLLDADALWAVGREPGMLLRAKAPVILTPHEGEFRMLGGSLEGGRLGAALGFAGKYGCILVLKGHHSIAAYPDGTADICPRGNAGMAKGGSGDVLAGVLGAMLCQFPLRQAVRTGLMIHSLAGDECARRFGEYSMTPTDMINCIPDITKNLSVR